MGGKTQTTTQNTTPAGLAQLGQIWNQVQSVASQPYTPYTGQLTAGLTSTQQSGINNINAAQGSAQPYFDQAAQYATQGAAPISAGAIQNYENPYTQSVVDATQNQFNQNNAVQAAQLTGNSAARGALGSRLNVNQGELARQQQSGEAPTIAGLYSNSYNSALGAAQADRSAAGQAAYTFGALAPSVQNAQLTGANAQLGAGAVEQGTNQAGLSAQYQQYLQQLAFPYQQAGFLASAGLPAATAMGGTSTTTAPGPNPLAQIAGVGLAGASLFSDERIKTDKRRVGKTDEGMPIYTFRYKGDPTTHMGLMAQDVEETKPDAVGEVGGIKTVDYAKATRKADGGPVGLFDVQTYVPKFSGVSASPVNYGSAPSAAKAADPFASAFTPQSLKSASTGLKSLFGSSSDVTPTGFTGNSSEAFNGVPDATTGYMGGISYPTFADGGSVVPDFDADFSPFAVPPNNTPANRDLALALVQKYDPQGAIELNAGAPLPRPRPFDAPGVPVGSFADDGQLPPQAMAYAAPGASPASPMSNAPAALPSAPPVDAVPAAASEKSDLGGWNPFNLSKEARLGLAAAGLGIAASKSPFALSAVGEGGLAGVKNYTEGMEQKQKAEETAKKLAQQATQFAQTIGLHKDTSAETARHNQAIEGLTRDQREEQKRQHDIADRKSIVPPGFRQTDDGSLEVVPGGPQDPAYIKASADAKRGTAGLLDADTIHDMAGQYLAGDKSVMQNLGRGAQGAENIVKLRAEIAQQARDAGLKPDQVATKMADFAGRTAAMRALGTRGVNVEYAANTANKAIDLAQDAYSKLPRGQFVPFNQLRELYDKKTSSPEQSAAYAATNTLVNEYARVAAGGSNQATEGMRNHAREMLNTAMGPQAFNAVLGMMRREIQTAKSAYNETRKEFLEDGHPRDEKSGTPGAASPATAGTPAASVVRQNGHTYQRQPDGSYKVLD